MSEAKDQPAEFDVTPPRRAWWRNLSVVWLVPILALIVSLGIAWNSYSQRGTLITILFDSAAGVKAGETTLQYRDVIVGHVERISFTHNLDQVEVEVRVDNEIVPYLDSSAQFWVVQPEVTAQGITGLSTVLSGVYIEGSWDRQAGVAQTTFTGLEKRPLVDENDKNGTWVTLRANSGAIMSAGAPVFYRGVKVGQTDTPQLDKAGTGVEMRAFVKAPHDRFITTNTRFWNTSGFNVSFGRNGLNVDVQSLASLVSGGVEFSSFIAGGTAITSGHGYDLYRNENDARENATIREITHVVKLQVTFKGGAVGLTPGADVRYEGVRIGQVSTLSSFVTRDGDDVTVHQTAVLDIEPEQLGLPEEASSDQVVDLMRDAVASGIRAKLGRGNFLGTSLVVDLDKVADAAPAQVDEQAQPYPSIPTVQADMGDLNASVEGALKQISKLNIEGLIDQAISTMKSIESVAMDQDLRAAPKAFTDLMTKADALIGSDQAQALPGDIRALVDELRTTVAAINDKGTVARIVSTLETADRALASVTTVADAMPALVDQVKDLAAKANALDLQSVVTSANQVLDSANAVIGTDAARALPAQVDATLAQVRLAVEEFNALGTLLRLNQGLDSADQTLANLSAASQDIPALIADLRAVADQARQADIDDLVASVTQLVKDADKVLATPAARELPQAMTDALRELRSMLEQLNQGGAAQNVNAALASARDAAQSVDQAAQGLPALTNRLDALITRADAAIAAYGSRSDFNAETLQMLREIRAAARSVSTLARTLERSPNSILFGR